VYRFIADGRVATVKAWVLILLFSVSKLRQKDKIAKLKALHDLLQSTWDACIGILGASTVLCCEISGFTFRIENGAIDFLLLVECLFDGLDEKQFTKSWRSFGLPQLTHGYASIPSVLLWIARLDSMQSTWEYIKMAKHPNLQHVYVKLLSFFAMHIDAAVLTPNALSLQPPPSTVLRFPYGNPTNPTYTKMDRQYMAGSAKELTSLASGQRYAIEKENTIYLVKSSQACEDRPSKLDFASG